MNINNSPFHKTLALILCMAMVLGMAPITAFAGDEPLPIGSSGEVIAFDPLKDNVANQEAFLGTCLEDLKLPGTLAATVEIVAPATPTDSVQDSGAPAQTEDKPGTAAASVPVLEWVSGPEYDPDTMGAYTFTPVLDEVWSLADGVELPTITVQVIMGIMPLAWGDNGIIDLSTLPSGNVSSTDPNTPWSWNSTEKTLTLTGAGPYTLTGTGTASIAANMSQDMEIMMDDGHLTAPHSTVHQGRNALTVTGSDKLTLTGNGSLAGGTGDFFGGRGIDASGGTGELVVSGNFYISGGNGQAGVDGILASGNTTLSGEIKLTGGNGSSSGTAGNGFYGMPGVSLFFSGIVEATGGDSSATFIQSGRAVVADSIHFMYPSASLTAKNGVAITSPTSMDFVNDTPNTRWDMDTSAVAGGGTVYDQNITVNIPAFPGSLTIRLAAVEPGSIINLSNSDADLTAGATASGGKYSYDDTTRIVTVHSGPVTITGSTTDRQVYVNGTVDVTLDNVDIDVSATVSAAAFLLESGADVTLTLKGDNSLKSGGYMAGLQVPGGTTLIMEASNAGQTLTATGGSTGAGIGGGQNISGGIITINGGTVKAIGYNGGAGIGSGRIVGGTSISGGIITINGGIIEAYCQSGNAVGIGTGQFIMGSRTASDITINGGSVKAFSMSDIPTDRNSNTVYLGSLPNQSGITSVSVDEIPFYIDDNHDGDDSLYLYMTGEDHYVDVEIGGTVTQYEATWNNPGFTWDSGTPQPQPQTTSVSLSLSPNPVIYGATSVTVTATVTDSSLGTRSLNMVDFYLDAATEPFASCPVISGVATATLDISSLSTGSYQIKAAYGGSFGGAASDDTKTLQIVVNAETPDITGQPASATYNQGDTAAPLSLAASVTDGGTLSYQWYSNTSNSTTGGTMVGTDSANYTPPTSAVGTTYYYCEVTNLNTGVNGNQTATATSNVATVTVNPIIDADTPSITGHPASATYNQGSTANPLTVTAGVSDGGTLSYQWYSNTSNSTTGGTMVGTNSANYTPPTSAVGTTYYYCEVTNTNTGVNGAQTAASTSNVAAVMVNSLVDAETPSISGHPASATYNQSGTANPLTVTAGVSDGGTLSYQWYSNTSNSTMGGTPVGTNSANYTPPTSAVSTTYYYCEVTNTNTSVSGNQTATAISNVAAVTVNSRSGSSSSDYDDSPTYSYGSITVYGVTIPYNIRNSTGVLTLDLTTSRLDSILAAADNSKTISINVGNPSGLKGLDISFPPAWFAQHTDVTFALQSGIGGIHLNNTLAQKYPAQDKAATVSLKSGSLILSAWQGGKTVTLAQPGSPMMIYMPYVLPKDTDANTVVMYDKTTGKTVAHSFYSGGRVYGAVAKPSTYDVKVIATDFTDTDKHWAKSDIAYAASRGLIPGTTATTFAPDRTITRADFLMALGKLSGADVSSYKTSSFTDVANDTPAMPYIEWAVANKIVQGFGDGKFGPNQLITREQMAVMVTAYAKATGQALPQVRTAAAFADSGKISPWAKDAVQAIQRANIIVGKTGNQFDPQGSMTRAEAATVLRCFAESVTKGRLGWVQTEKGQWQYIKSDYTPTTGWLSITDTDIMYYFDEKGLRVEGKWLQISGKWYYFGADGKMAVNTEIDGYKVGADGVRIE